MSHDVMNIHTIGLGEEVGCEANHAGHAGLKTLCIISKIIVQGGGQREMLLEILDTLESRHNMTGGMVITLCQNGGELVVSKESPRETIVTGNAFRQKPYSRGYQELVNDVHKSGKPVVIAHISQEPLLRNLASRLGRDGGESFICVPIFLGSDVIGSLSVFVSCDPDLSLIDSKWLLDVISGMIANDIKDRQSARFQRDILERENLQLRNQLHDQFRSEAIIGNSRDMRQVYARVHQVAGTNTTVLITGEPGTGKELVASAIHYAGSRADKPFVKVNCSVQNEQLLEVELFGQDRDCVSNAYQCRTGRLDEAGGGTLYLDEIGYFSPQMQARLLRLIQEREFQRSGSSRALVSNVRVICATSRDLLAETQKGSFRPDLYYLVNEFPIFLPPLRGRQNDILLLANYFVEKHSRLLHKEVQRISSTTVSMLLSYHWPGNVRELENCIEHAVLVSDDNVLHGYNLPPSLQSPDAIKDPKACQLKTRVNALEKDMIMDSLRRNNGRISESAKELGITSRMVRYKIEKLAIDYVGMFKRHESYCGLDRD